MPEKHEYEAIKDRITQKKRELARLEALPDTEEIDPPARLAPPQTELEEVLTSKPVAAGTDFFGGVAKAPLTLLQHAPPWLGGDLAKEGLTYLDENRAYMDQQSGLSPAVGDITEGAGYAVSPLVPGPKFSPGNIISKEGAENLVKGAGAAGVFSAAEELGKPERWLNDLLTEEDNANETQNLWKIPFAALGGGLIGPLAGKILRKFRDPGGIDEIDEFNPAEVTPFPASKLPDDPLALPPPDTYVGPVAAQDDLIRLGQDPQYSYYLPEYREQEAIWAKVGKITDIPEIKSGVSPNGPTDVVLQTQAVERAVTARGGTHLESVTNWINQRLQANDILKSGELPQKVDNAISRMADEELESVARRFPYLKKFTELLRNERGSVPISQTGNVGIISKYLLNMRRVAEKYPEFQPFYTHLVENWQGGMNAAKHDLLTALKPYIGLSKTDQAAVDVFLRQRRRDKLPDLPPNFSPAQIQAVEAVDTMTAVALEKVNAARSTKGLPPVSADQFYVPFSRKGNYIIEIPAAEGRPRLVTQRGTRDEAEQAIEQYIKQYNLPGKSTDYLFVHEGKSGSPLDIGTIKQLENWGLMSPEEAKQALSYKGIDFGFSGHFEKAHYVLGEETDLLKSFTSYIEGLASYTAKFEFAPEANRLLGDIQNSAVREIGTQLLEYAQNTPREFARLRGFMSVWALGANLGSAFQNLTQMGLVGMPRAMSQFGTQTATKSMGRAFKALVSPTAEEADVLARAERLGILSPVNTAEMWGQQHGFGSGLRGFPQLNPSTAELGYPTIQRYADDGNCVAGMAAMFVKHLARGWRGTANEFETLKPALMLAFTKIEEMNRKLAFLTGYHGARAYGASVDDAFNIARGYNRDVNFDYSHFSRPGAWRGWGATPGLFMTYQTEYLSTLSKLFGDTVKTGGKKLPPLAAMVGAAFAMGGLRSNIPNLDDFDVLLEGAVSENVPDSVYYGPLSDTAGLDFSSKFMLGLPGLSAVLSDPQSLTAGRLDVSDFPFTRTPLNAFRAKTLAEQGKEWEAVKKLMPSSVYHLATGMEWLNGQTVSNSTGTPVSRPILGEPQNYNPTTKDAVARMATFSPLEKTKMHHATQVAYAKKSAHTEPGSRFTPANIRDY